MPNPTFNCFPALQLAGWCLISLASIVWAQEASVSLHHLQLGEPSRGFLPIELTVLDDPNLIFGLQTSSDLQNWESDSAGWVVLARLNSEFQKIGFLADTQQDASGFMRVRVAWNTPPKATNDRIVLNQREPTALDVFANDSDADGDSVVLVEYREPDHGQVTYQEGALFYEPPPNFSGTDRFEYSIRDSHGALSTATVQLIIPAADDTDADELPNAWEIEFGLDPSDPSDQMADADADGYPNLYEFHHGSDPTNIYSHPNPTTEISSVGEIQQALLAAPPFAIVGLTPGNYAGGDWELPGDRPVMITASAGRGTCTIDVGTSGARRAFNFDVGQDQRSVVSGLTIQNGRGSTGTGMRFVDQSAATLIDCVFEGGSSELSGGAVYIREASPRFERCVFERNTAGGFGGAVYAKGRGTELTFSDCAFTSNKATSDGGAVYVTGEAASTFNKCAFHENQALENGGALAFGTDTEATVRRCFFVSNVSGADGGAISCRLSAQPAIMNSVLAKNNAGRRGGAVYSGNEALPSLTHCTLTENTAESGGGVYHFKTSVVEIRNSILWGNIPQQLQTNGGEHVTHSIIQDGNSDEGNSASDPMLIPGDVLYRLRIDSPARAEAMPEGTPMTDIDGELRSQPGDIGADEFVDHDADGMADRWEMNVGLNPAVDDAADDLDGDGETNLAAYVTGNDPASNLSPTVHVSGRITTPGGPPSAITVMLVSDPESWRPSVEISAESSGEFDFDEVPRWEPVWLKAFQDSNGNGVREPCEPASAPQLIDPTNLIGDLILTLPPIDSDPPIFNGVPEDLSVQSLQEIPEAADVTAMDGNQVVEVAFEESSFALDSPNQVVRKWTAIDPCGNTATATQVIAVTPSGSAEIGRFLTSFEPGQGYALGPVTGQDGWIGSADGALVTEKHQDRGGTRSLGVTLPEAEAMRSFNVNDASLVDLTFSLYLEAVTGRPPAVEKLPQDASAIVSYDASRGVVALDGDGLGGGKWVVIPETRVPDKWLEVRIVKDDAKATWSLSLDGKQVRNGLGYKNRSRRGLARFRVRNGDDGSVHIDNLILTHQ